VIGKESKYHGQENFLEGRVVAYKIDGNLLNLVVLGKEKVQVFYYFETEEEKKYWESCLEYGDIVRLQGRLSKPLKATIPNTFSYYDYLYYHHIFWIFEGKEIQVIRKHRGLFVLKNWFIQQLKEKKHSNYFMALLLGNNTMIEQKDIRFNGISHLFAVSGMHVGLLLGGLSFFLRSGGKKKNIILIIVLLFYAFLVGFTPSIMRAIGFFLLSSFNKYMKIGWNNKKIVLFLFCFFCLYDPFLIMDLGFQYSFVVSFALCYLQRRGNYLYDLWCISFWSFLASLPITAMNFYEVNFLAIIWNMFFVPFVTLALYPILIFSLCFSFFRPLLDILLYLFEWINQWCANISFGVVVIPHVPDFLWLGYFLILYSFLNKQQRRYVFMLFFLIVGIILSPRFQFDAYMYFLDVGQGDCILFVAPFQRSTVLIDVGGRMKQAESSWQQRINTVSLTDKLVTFFHSIGISSLSFAIFSHGDYDHMGEAVSFVNRFKIESVIFNHDEYNDLELEVIKILDEKNIPYYQDIEYVTVDQYQLFFLNTGLYSNENDNSNVIYLEVNHTNFLFMGDASVSVERKIMQKYPIKNIDILKIGHHGSDTSTSKEFLEKMNPKISIISVGKNNRYGHPKKNVLDLLSFSKLYRTDVDGSIKIKLKKDTYEVTTSVS